MDKLVVTWIILQVFSLLIVFVAGSRKTDIGKKLKAVGMSLMVVTNLVQLSFFGSTLSTTARDIFFSVGVAMTLVLMYKLVSILKSILPREKN